MLEELRAGEVEQEPGRQQRLPAPADAAQRVRRHTHSLQRPQVREPHPARKCLGRTAVRETLGLHRTSLGQLRSRSLRLGRGQAIGRLVLALRRRRRPGHRLGLRPLAAHGPRRLSVRPRHHGQQGPPARADLRRAAAAAHGRLSASVVRRRRRVRGLRHEGRGIQPACHLVAIGARPSGGRRCPGSGQPLLGLSGQRALRGRRRGRGGQRAGGAAGASGGARGRLDAWCWRCGHLGEQLLLDQRREPVHLLRHARGHRLGDPRHRR
mmetsp:Transcript_95653/g.241080  ORF Transcript_95653/g.241080 Transcript_95653/m.241080 type:complete len:267 (+) Transcript_95653:1758-2558(+)